MADAGSIGERVRQLRTGRLPRLTQRELAEKSGVSVDLISKLEQGAKQSALLVTCTTKLRSGCRWSSCGPRR
jgi:predicted transcriptional regulator